MTNRWFRLQNFFIGENVTHENYTYIFSPFGFSGLSTSRQGDNIEPPWCFPTTKSAVAISTTRFELMSLTEFQVINAKRSYQVDV